MFESLFNAIEKFVNDFSWRRLFTWIIVLIVIICSAWTLEYYTGYLRLARIDKTIELLKKLGDVQEIQRSTADESLRNIYQSIRSDLANFVAPPSSGTDISPGFMKAAAGALPWALFACIFLPAFRRGEKEAPYGIVGALFFAVLFGAVGWVLPEFDWKLINYLIYPLGHFIVIVMLIYSFQQWRNKRMARASQAIT